MVRRVLLMLVGIGSTVGGAVKYGKEPTAAEKTGYLFQHFGPNGVSMGMMIMGLVFFGLGLILTTLQIRALRGRRPLG